MQLLEVMQTSWEDSILCLITEMGWQRCCACYNRIYDQDRHSSQLVDLLDLMQTKQSQYRQGEHPMMSLWRNGHKNLAIHIVNANCTNILILSPDTDVYHIGLPIVANTNLKVFVQLSKFTEREVHLVDVQALIKAFQNQRYHKPLRFCLMWLCFLLCWVSESGVLTDKDKETSFLSF